MGILTQLWEAIPVYTGLSSTTFCTVVALLIAVYYLASHILAPPEFKYVPVEPPRPPIQLGTITEDELRAYDGSDANKPILIAIRGQIYDVTPGRVFYGPGAMYGIFAGRDASRALAKMSFEEKDLNGNIEDLSPFEVDALNDWEYKFKSKYVKVGEIGKPEELSKEVTREVADTDATADESIDGGSETKKEE